MVSGAGGEGHILLDGLIPAPPGVGGADKHHAVEVTASSAFDDLVQRGPEWRVSASGGPTAIIPGVLAAAGVAIVAGEPKVGKTWLVADLAISVATGHAFLGHYPVKMAGRVLYIATEGSHAAMRGRFDGLARGKGLEPEHAVQSVDFIWRASILVDEAFTEWLATTTYLLVIVDVLRDAWRGDENDNSAVAELMRRLKTVASGGSTILLVHHMGKSTQDTMHRRAGQRIRGASTFHAGLDSGIYLEKSKNSTRTRVTFEAKDDVEEAGCTFAWPEMKVDGEDPITLDWQPGDDTVTRAAEMVPAVTTAIESEPGLSRTAIVKKMHARQQVVMEAIDRALDQGLIEERIAEYTQSNGRRRKRPGLYVVRTPSQRSPSHDTVSGAGDQPATPSHRAEHEPAEVAPNEFLWTSRTPSG